MRFKTSPVGGRWTPCTWVMAVYSGRDRIYINRKEYSSPALLLVLLKVVCVCASQKRYRSRNKVHFREYAGDFSLTNITLAQLERAEGPMAERVTKAFLLKDFSLYASCERARVYMREREFLSWQPTRSCLLELYALHHRLFWLRVPVALETRPALWAKQRMRISAGARAKIHPFVTTNCGENESQAPKRYPRRPIKLQGL